MNYYVNYSRGQLKIQQMAFVLVALMILFGIALLFYISITLHSLRGEVSSLKDDEAAKLVKMLAFSPEFKADNCPNCVDLDKIMLLKYRNSYKEFWNLDYLRVDKIYPLSNAECELSNYPECSTITLVKKRELSSPSSAFVSLCRWEGEYKKCELGRIYASGEGMYE